MRYVFLSAMLLTFAVTTLQPVAASYLEDQEQAAPPPRIIAPPPVPSPHDPLSEVVRNVVVRDGYTYKGLTVFPLTLSEIPDSTDYLSLNEALRKDVLIVTEKDRGAVPVLLGENTGKRYVLLLAGEMLAGGKQNRVLRTDVLLPPHSGKVELPVFCVERRRWTGRRMSFEENPAVAGPRIRALVQDGESQEAVWGGVESYQRSLNISSDTDDLRAVTDSPEVKHVVADYQSAVAGHLPRDTVGMVVASHWRIIGADLFCNPDVFRKHRDRLIESYALDCYVARRHGEPIERDKLAPAPPGSHMARRFLRQVLDAQRTWTPTPGAGRLLRVRGARLNGLALVRGDAVVHAALFARAEVRPLPMSMPLPQIEE